MDKLYELIELGHKLFQIIEDRDFSYKLTFNVIHKKEMPSSDDIQQLKNSVDEWIDYDNGKKNTIKDFIKLLSCKHYIKGKLLLLYLLSWNMNRFSDCSNFQVENLRNFSKYLEENLFQIVKEYDTKFNSKTIKDVLWVDVKQCIEDINKVLKSKCGKQCFHIDHNESRYQNEYVGAFKISHILFPKIFIPLDNPIAEGLGLKKQKQNWDIESDYKKLWTTAKVLYNNENFLKKMDEMLYMIFSTTKKKKDKVKKLLNL